MTPEQSSEPKEVNPENLFSQRENVKFILSMNHIALFQGRGKRQRS